MESVEKHIEVDKKILEDPTTSPQQRRHIEGELQELEVYATNHKAEIEAGRAAERARTLRGIAEKLKPETL